MIDGHKGSKNLDDGAKHELATMLFPTLKQGLGVARTLSIELEVEPDYLRPAPDTFRS